MKVAVRVLVARVAVWLLHRRVLVTTKVVLVVLLLEEPRWCRRIVSLSPWICSLLRQYSLPVQEYQLGIVSGLASTKHPQKLFPPWEQPTC